MGGGSSTPRAVTIEEDEASGMIKVSDAVARRLLGHPEPAGDVAGRRPIQPSMESQEDVRIMQEFYQRRISALESQNEDLMKETQEAFAQAVQEVEQRFQNRTAPQPICQDLQEEVLKCYQANPKQTLNCSAQVKAFNDCVQRQREKILSRKEG